MSATQNGFRKIMKKTIPTIGPVSFSERIQSLDILRGFAVLGILIMNIQSYSMIEAAYLNPTAYGDLTGLNKWVWILSHIFSDQKFMTIFSILFGAGVLLMAQRRESKGYRAAGVHYRRTLWLFVIGAIHAYLLWHGDILVVYALCSLLVFLFRRLSPKKLLVIGLILISVSSLIYLLIGFSISAWPPEAYEQSSQYWMPNEETIEHEISAYRSGWQQQMTHRVPSSIAFHTFIFLIWSGWRAGGLMILGMALFKWGVLTAERSNRFYRLLAVVGFCIGLPVVILGVVRNFAAGWSFDFSMFKGWQFNYWGSIFVSLAYISIIMLISKSAKWNKFTSPFAAVGRMALTNYLMQTLILTLIFYGHGLGLFGKVERKEQILFIVGLWIFQLIVSPLWLRYFKFGPAEWLWRSLTYWKIQPMRNR
jgi:uncharacterized protein